MAWKIVIAPSRRELQRDPKAQARSVIDPDTNEVIHFETADDALQVITCMEQVPQGGATSWEMRIEPFQNSEL